MRVCLIAQMLCLAATATLTPTMGALAQAAIEHHVWQDQRSFEPLSRTAIAITGAINLSGTPKFAEVGSRMTMSFGGGPAIDLVSEGASWREWSLNGGKQTAEVFRLAADPGPLHSDNKICGDKVRYIVFFEGNLFGSGGTLEVAAFDSKKPPFDINSDGLCGTFAYSIE